MNIVSVCIICIVSTVTILSIKKYNPEISMLIALGAGVVVAFFLISEIEPVINEINQLIDKANIQNTYSKILFKCLGICFLCQFASDACSDAGERSLASKIELCGKITILILGLPLINDILKISIELMN